MSTLVRRTKVHKHIFFWHWPKMVMFMIKHVQNGKDGTVNGKSSVLGKTRSINGIHDSKLHVLWWLPMALPLIYKPVVYLFLIQSRHLSQRDFVCFLQQINNKTDVNYRLKLIKAMLVYMFCFGVTVGYGHLSWRFHQSKRVCLASLGSFPFFFFLENSCLRVLI